MERLTKAGIYIAEHLTTHEQFLVNVIGTAPLLKITNIVNLNEFSENVIIDNDNIYHYKTELEEGVNDYSWIPLEHKKYIQIKRSNPLQGLNNYQCLKDNYEDYRKLILNERENEVLMDICTKENVSVEVAQEIIKELKQSYRD